MARSPIAMFRAFRSARSARALLLAAAFFAVAGSFGLHPEPAAELAAPAPVSSLPRWIAAEGPGSPAADPCTACLAHRSLSLTGLDVFLPAGAPALRVLAPPPAQPLPLCAPRFVDGRAPPSLG